MLTMPALPPDADLDTATAWFGDLSARMASDELDSTKYTIAVAKKEGEVDEWFCTISTIRHGIPSDSYILHDFFESSEYQAIKTLAEQLDGLVGEGAYVQRGERKFEIKSFKEAMTWLMEEAKRGQHIQRYKGLGEMNPEQLFETTLNPETRRLLQVQIEDAIAADEIFTTLMGDHVEPRRDFIESNALNAMNLDV
jgi:DNA gyrase subunit B